LTALLQNLSNPLLESSGLPKFSAIRAEHVEPAVESVLSENRRALEQLLDGVENTVAEFETVILPLEGLADRLHHVWAPVSHLHAVANSPELRAAYNKCLPALSRYETELAHNDRLYRLFRDVSDNLPAAHNDGASSLLRHAIRDFHLAGVDLPAEKKQRFQIVMEELSQLQAKFEQNILDSMAAWSHHEPGRERVAGIPATVLEQAEHAARDDGRDGYLFRLDQPTYIAVITHAANRDLRYQFYRAWVTRASDQFCAGIEHDNSEVIEHILALRHEAAGLVGFDNYAEYSLATKMAGSVQEVHEFLNELASHSRPAAQRELGELERFAGRALAAWDVPYYAERLRRDRYSVSDEELRPYFPLDRVLTGLFDVVKKLYGISVEPATGIDTWQTDVRFYRLHDQEHGEIGGFYVDLFARPNKRSGAWMDECLIRKSLHGQTQMPVAHLVCNFAAPTRALPCLMTHDEVVTLFHEFGHTLHHLLTRVNYPSVAGINGVPWDAVELPSQFMENFAWEPEVVRLISGHHRTGEPLPEALLDKLRASRVFQAGMQMVRQLEFALFDLRLYSEFQPQKGSQMATLLEEVRGQVAVVRHPEFNRFAHAFSHIFGGGYAAGYYSYKWAEVLAADAYSAFEEQGPFDGALAARFRRQILEVGGTVDIGEAFKAFRGRGPEIGPLLSQAGIEPGGSR
jgi:oligopeptidase A